MRALVFGATGYTGREVVHQLAEGGHQVVAHIRPDSSSLERWRPVFEGWGARVDTSAWTDEAIAAAVAEHAPEVVFSLLGTTRKRASSEGMGASEAYERIDYGLSAMVIRGAAGLEPPPCIVYLSSVGVSPETRNPYLAARAKVEAELRDSALPFVIARPSFITGGRDESRPAEAIAAGASNSLLALAGALGARRLRDRYRSMDNRQLASALIAAAIAPEWRGRVLQGDDLRPLIAET